MASSHAAFEDISWTAPPQKNRAATTLSRPLVPEHLMQSQSSSSSGLDLSCRHSGCKFCHQAEKSAANTAMSLMLGRNVGILPHLIHSATTRGRRRAPNLVLPWNCAHSLNLTQADRRMSHSGPRFVDVNNAMALVAQAGAPAGSTTDADPLTLEDEDVLRCFAVGLVRFGPLRLGALFCVRAELTPSMSMSGTAIEPGGGGRGVATAACGGCDW